jgi:hypothetical protein
MVYFNMVSIDASSSAENSILSRHFSESNSCAGLLAPISTDVTRSSFNNQANAICANALSTFFSHIVQLFDLVELVIGQHFFFKETSRPCRARIFGDTMKVFIGQHTLCQWRKWNTAYPFLPNTSIRPPSTQRSNIEYFG